MGGGRGMSWGFERDGDGLYELVRDGIAVLCNTATLAVDAGNPNPSIFHPPSSIFHPPSSIFHPPSSIFHLPSRTYPTLLSYNPDTSASQPVLPFPSPSSSPFSFSSPHLPSICLFSFCPARPSSRRCAYICVDLVVGGWGFVSGFV